MLQRHSHPVIPGILISGTFRTHQADQAVALISTRAECRCLLRILRQQTEAGRLTTCEQDATRLCAPENHACDGAICHNTNVLCAEIADTQQLLAAPGREQAGLRRHIKTWRLVRLRLQNRESGESANRRSRKHRKRIGISSNDTVV